MKSHLTSRLGRIEKAVHAPVCSRERPKPHLISRRLSDTSRAALIGQYAAGSSIKTLARQFSLSEYSVREVLVAGGAKSRGDAVTASQVEEIVTMRTEARSLDAIARAVGLSIGTVRIVLAAHN